VAYIGDEIAGCAPALVHRWSSAMQRRFNQIDSPEDRLAQEAVKLRKQAQGTPADH
jgi:hypothetical protein